MITRIEIDGFKTFKDFSLDFEPLHVIIGPNASGKSNLFDALKLFSRLATNDVVSAFTSVERGSETEQFTILPDGSYNKKIKFIAEFLLDKNIEDPYGEKGQLKYTRLRYGIEISNIDGTLYVTKEQLSRINKNEDNWYRNHISINHNKDHWEPDYLGGKHNLIYKGKMPDTGESGFFLRGDADKSRPRNFRSSKLKKSVLSSVTGVDYVHAYAVKKELSTFRFLQLNPDKIRQPSSIIASTELTAEGENIAAVLNRLKETDKFLLTDVSRDISNLIPGIFKIKVEENKTREQFEIWVENEEGNNFSLPLVSEGTLRLLVLSTLKNDLKNSQTIFLEEPENGVHISRLKKLLDLLSNMTTNFNLDYATNFPLRQIIINTHSIPLIRFLRENNDLFKGQLPGISIAEIFTHIDPDKKWKLRISKMESLDINYGSSPFYKQEPSHLFSKLERLLYSNSTATNQI